MSQDKSWKQIWHDSPGPNNLKNGLKLSSKGILMGVADLIPGVSGGTMAFISGIYENLLDAISSVKTSNIKNFLSFKWKKAAEGIHLKFIFFLFTGILVTMVTMARFMHYLLNHHPIPTWSIFFGLILASVYILAKQLDRFSVSNIGFMILGTAIGYAVVSLIPVETPEKLWFIYLCGIISITAMILPGISGSFLMLILGKYEYITGALKNPTTLDNLTILIIFAFGCLTGIMSFSRFLNYCMKNFHNQTMAILTGIMLGSLKKVWPWKVVTESKMVRGKLKVIQEANFIPNTVNQEVIIAIILMILAMILILYLHFYVERNQKVES